MNLGRLLIAGVLLAGLTAAVWWSNKKTAADAGKPPADAPPKILTLKKEDVQQIEFKRREGDPAIVKKNAAGKWELTAPKQLPAAQSAVDAVLSVLAEVNSERLLDSNATNLGDYGLMPPLVEVDITMKDGKVSKLQLGEDTPTASATYAKLDGDPRLFTTASSNKTGLDKTYQDLRDKSVLLFDSDKVSRVELTAKKQTTEFGRVNQSDWQILKPKPMRADGFQVEDLVRKVKDAMMETLTEEQQKKAATDFASAAALATLKVTDPSGTQTLEIHKAKDDYLAKSSSVPGILKVSADLGMALDKSATDFRAKKLFDFGFSDPGKVQVKDGTKDTSYEKSGDKWNSGGKAMDSVGVQSLIDKLRDLAAIKFPDSGFTTPVFEVTVVSNDGKRIEKVQIGANNIARRDGEPALYELDAKAVSDLRQAASDIRPAAPPASSDKKK